MCIYGAFSQCVHGMYDVGVRVLLVCCLSYKLSCVIFMSNICECGVCVVCLQVCVHAPLLLSLVLCACL